MLLLNIYLDRNVYFKSFHLCLISLILSKGYWVAEENANCAAYQIISTSSACKVASANLGLKFFGFSRTKLRPAGCYKYTDKDVYFNHIIDPEMTSPEGNTAGICAQGMINCRVSL